MKLNLTLLLQIAGVLHLGLMCAGLLMPRVVEMRLHLAKLPPFIRQLFWIYYSFIGLCLVSFCIITIAFADTLATGSPLARALCAFFALFWTVRLYAATFVFDMGPYLTNGFRRLGYHAINIVFADQPAYFELRFIPVRSPEAECRFSGIEAFESSNDLIVISEEGAVYQGPPAFIMCLYALMEFREWSLRLSSPLLLPFARQMFEFVSDNRAAFSKWLRKTSDDEIARELQHRPPPLCGNKNVSCLLAAKQKAATYGKERTL